MADQLTIDAKSARILPWIVAVSFFIQLLDGTILNTALPSIAKDLQANPLQMQCVVIAYMLTVAVVIPSSGWLSDRFGIKQVFFSAMTLFTAGSLFCGMSPTLEMLVAGRVIQGIGGALMVPVGRLAVLRSFPREQLFSIMSFILMPGLIGPLIGPTLGGFLVEYITWHWIFFINIPIGIAGLILTFRYMPRFARAENLQTFDRTGFILFGSFMLATTLGLDGISELHLPPVQVAALIIAGIACLIAFFLYVRRRERPLFSLDLFKVRNFSVGMLGNIFARLGNGAMPFLSPLFLQVGLGFSPMKAGFFMIPMTVGAIAAKSKLANRLITRFGFRNVLVANTLILGCAISQFSLLTPDASVWHILLVFGVFGIFNSMQFTAMNTVTLIDLSDTQVSHGNSLFSAVQQLGMGMGVAVAAAILEKLVENRAILNFPDIRACFAGTYICLGIMAAVSTLIFLFVKRDTGRTAGAK